MLHNEKGFFLMEIIVSFFVLTTVLATAIPIWIHVQEQDKANQMKSTALYVAQNEMARFYYDDHYPLASTHTNEQIKEGTRYYVEWVNISISDSQVEQWRLSLRWETPKKSYERIEFQLYGN